METTLIIIGILLIAAITERIYIHYAAKKWMKKVDDMKKKKLQL